MTKIIEKVKAWRYPCEEIFYKENSYVWSRRIILTKKLLEKLDKECLCGKSCKPERIEVIVRRRKDENLMESI